MPRIQIKLTDDEVQTVRDLAAQRNLKAKRFGSKTYNGKNTSAETHILGLAGEFAIAKLCGVPVDSRIYSSHGDDGTDLVLPGIGNVAIKTTTYVDKPLLRAEVHRHKDVIDYYIACYVNANDISDVWFIGWATTEEVLNAKQRKFLRYGPTNYVLTEEQMRDPNDLIKMSTEPNP
jgi:hypothetical protein